MNHPKKNIRLLYSLESIKNQIKQEQQKNLTKVHWRSIGSLTGKMNSAFKFGDTFFTVYIWFLCVVCS